MAHSTVDTKRNSEKRLRLAKTVQLRDAEPLIKLEELIAILVAKVDASGGFIALSTEEDFPIAVHGDVTLPLVLEPDHEETLFSNEVVKVNGHICHPIRKSDGVVGFLAINFEGRSLSPPVHHLLDAYATLTAKELELADKTAKLQYQNEKISRKQRQLEQAIAFKNNILSLTTHDIRSPLNAVTGYLELLESHVSEHHEQDDELTEYHEKITAGVQNIADLIDQLNEIALLELQRIDLNLVKVDLNWIAQEVCDVMQGPAISKKQNLILDRCDKPLYVEVDIPKMKRVLFNLISNAIKYTGTDGDIAVKLMRDKGMAHIAVQDSGMGIPEEKLEAIFEPFQKFQKSGTEGELSTGLGLFTSNYFTQLFKGSLSVESEVTKGSIFYVHLPIVQVPF